MIDLEEVAIYCLVAFTTIALIWGTHLATMRSVRHEISEWRAVTVQSQAVATECLAALEGAGVQAP
jgi:hypothetical protein